MTAVEIDPVLARQLPKTIAEHSHSEINRLTVLNRDILTLHRPDLAEQPTALVANLPYNVAVPALLHLLAEFPSIRTVMVMVQAEVAERLAAEPGGKDYGVPSVKVRFFGNVRRYGMVSPTVFWPIPRVYSGLVRIDRHEAVAVADRPRFPHPGVRADRRGVRAAPQDVAQRVRRVGGFGQRVGPPAARRQHRPVAPRRDAVGRGLRPAAAALRRVGAQAQGPQAQAQHEPQALTSEIRASSAHSSASFSRSGD